MEQGIDFVIPWVDGADAQWQNEKKKYKATFNADASVVRYRDWGLLRYWFRGVEKFAPWVRKIHFITWGHMPDWLNTNHLKLNIVTHSDFIPAQYLPTFSANPIELNFHRIEDLSNQFVYFNDDMFLLQPTVPEDFFRTGKPCDAAIFSPVIVSAWDDIGSIVANDLCILNQHFTKGEVIGRHPWHFYNLRYSGALLRTLCLSPWRHWVGFQNHHVAQSFLKQTFQQVWEAEPQILHETCTHRFRDYKRDVNQWLMRYWQFASGNFMPVSPRRWKDLLVTRTEDTANAIKHQKYQRICINDADMDSFEQTRGAVIQAFEHILPTPSSFERG